MTEYYLTKTKKKWNSVAFNLQANYTDRAAAMAIYASANFCWQGVSRGQRKGSLRPLISVF
jgi:hypothetical protein